MAEIADMRPLDRAHPLQDRLFGGNGIVLRPAKPAGRLSLRAGAEALAPLGAALGIGLPDKIGDSAAGSGITAMCIGPDEWLVIAEDDVSPAERLEGLAEPLFSAVDISHRNTAIELSGHGATDVVSAGCPRDLRDAAFPVGACARTLLGKAEIVLLREARDKYRIECWRSFSDYVWKYLVDAAKSG